MDTNFLGCFAEYLFCAECTKRGIIISMPVLDSSPYDCVIDIDGKLIKVQVKSTKKKPLPRRNSVNIPLCNQKSRYTLEVVDYFAIYSEHFKGFFVFPNTGDMKSIRLSIKGKNKIYFSNFDFE
jgi:hypothetical protein